MVAAVTSGHHNFSDGANVVSGEVRGWRRWLNGWTRRGVMEKLVFVESSVHGFVAATYSHTVTVIIPMYTQQHYRYP